MKTKGNRKSSVSTNAHKIQWIWFAFHISQMNFNISLIQYAAAALDSLFYTMFASSLSISQKKKKSRFAYDLKLFSSIQSLTVAMMRSSLSFPVLFIPIRNGKRFCAEVQSIELKFNKIRYFTRERNCCKWTSYFLGKTKSYSDGIKTNFLVNMCYEQLFISDGLDMNRLLSCIHLTVLPRVYNVFQWF